MLSLPGGNEDNDLFVQVIEEDGRVPIFLSQWEPTKSERAKIANGERINLLVWGKQHPPVAMTVGYETTDG